MNIRRINHVGILVTDLEGAVAGFRDLLGLELDHTERYGDQLDIAFLPCGETLVEIIEPFGEGWSREWLTEHGPGIQHVAFEVDDLPGTMTELADRGATFTLGRDPLPGAGGMMITFLDPEPFGGVIVELCQPAGELEG